MRKPWLTAITALALASCAQKPVLGVSDAWVRLGAVPGSPAAAYFTVKGGPADDRLMIVTADYAVRTELHESMTSGGMASMKPLASGVPVPAGGKVEFKPGGLHAMLFDVEPGLQPPRTMPMTFTFASGTRLQLQATLVRAGDK